jgi:hypothetical protein
LFRTDHQLTFFAYLESLLKDVETSNKTFVVAEDIAIKFISMCKKNSRVNVLFSERFLKYLSKLESSRDLWGQVLNKAKLSNDIYAQAFDSEHDEDEFQLKILDQVDPQGNLIFSSWTRNVKLAIYIRNSFK